MPLPPAALPDATVPAASADLIDTLLPQTQCRQCGFSGCRPYAEAIAGGSAAINRCPPGGDELITEIAAVLGVTPLALDTTLGQATPPAVACIDESACIGCALCLDVCPVDAIVGARKWMHTVITSECTGCGLCVPPCPVDCITLVPTGAALNRAAQRAESARLRQRYQAHLRRQQRKTTERLEQRSRSAEIRKRDTVARAMARARKRLTPR